MIFKTKLGKYLGRKSIKNLTCCAMILATLQAPAFCEKHRAAIKSVHNELSIVNVNKSNWYPLYHLASPAYVMKQPTAFSAFGPNYHLFFQQNYKNKDGENLVWGHAISPDLVNWKHISTAIAPSEEYDNNGILGGSAIEDDGLLYLVYTGKAITPNNEETEDNTKIYETQNLAMSKDGINFGKSANNSVIKAELNNTAHQFSNTEFRNPYVWKLEDDYYALVGTQYEKTKDGAVILFKSKDLRNWEYLNVTAIGNKGEMGTMWEAPALIKMGENDLLSISAQGIKPHDKLFLNKYQSGAFLGKLDYKSGNFAQQGAFMLYDYGFDFYAPQFVKTADGRTIFIAWLGMDGTPMYESNEHWAGMMTIPRELQIVDGKIKTYPIKELENLRETPISIDNQIVKEAKEFKNISGDAYEIELVANLTNSNSFEIKLRASDEEETSVIYDKENKVLKLNRDKSGTTKSGGVKGEREAKLQLTNNILNLRIFVDKSSIEIFSNDGEIAMSSRIYPSPNATAIKFVSNGETKIEKLNFYKFKTQENNTI